VRGAGVTQAGYLWVAQNCAGPFAAYVGVPLEQSRYDIGASFPLPDFRAKGVQRSLCWLTSKDASLLTQPVKGTAQ
jgi:hypothetical protein